MDGNSLERFLRDLCFERVIENSNGRDGHTPYFIQGTPNTPVTIAFDHKNDMWMVSKRIDLTPYGFKKRTEDVAMHLTRLNRHREARRVQEARSKKPRW